MYICMNIGNSKKTTLSVPTSLFRDRYFLYLYITLYFNVSSTLLPEKS